MDAKMHGIFFILVGISGIINGSPFTWLSSTEVDDYSLYDYLENQNFQDPRHLFTSGLLKTVVDGVRDSKRSDNNLKKNEIENSKTYLQETSLDDSGRAVTNSKAPHSESRSSQFQSLGSTIFISGHTGTSMTTIFNAQALHSKLETTPDENPSTADENFSTTDVNPSTPDENPSTTPDENPSTTDENHSTADENPSTATENPSTTDENPSTPDGNPSTPNENPLTPDANPSSTADENSSTVVINEASSVDYKTVVTGGITKSETVVTEIPTSSDTSTDPSPATSNPIEIGTSTQFPNSESSSQGKEIRSTRLAPSREPITDFNAFSSTMDEKIAVSLTTRELADGTTTNSKSGSTESSVRLESGQATVAPDHIIRISSIRTARMIVSVVFIVIALVAASVLAVYLFTVKRRGVQYDQLLLLH